MSAYITIKLISSILYIISGFLVLIRNTKRIQNQVLSLSLFSLAFMEYGYFTFLMRLSLSIGITVALIGHCLAHINITLLSLVYGRENYRDSLKRGRSYLIFGYLISLIFIIMVISGIIETDFIDHSLVFNKIGSVSTIFLLICTLLTLMNLENTFHQAGHNQNLIKLPTLILVSALSFHVLVYSLIMGFSHIRIEILIIASLSLLLSSIFMVYSVIKPRSSESKIYVDRAVITKSYTLLLAGLYLLIVGMLGKIIQIVSKNLNYFFAFLIVFFVIFALISVILSRSLKHRFQSFIQRNFYRHRYDYRQEWDNFSRRVFSNLSMKDLLREVGSAVFDTIKPDNISIMILNENNGLYEVAVSDIDNNISISAQNGFIEWLWRYGKPIKLDNGRCVAYGSFSDPPNIPEEFTKLFRKSLSGILVPIISEHRLMAIMIIGNRKDPPYNQEDLDLLETMANQISIAIINAKTSQELSISRELESFNKISGMLLHDLKSSASMLSLVIQNANDNFDNPEFQKDALSTMSSVVNRIQKLILRLSTTPQEIDIKLNFQPVDIVSLVKSAIDKSGVRRLERITLVENLEPVSQLSTDPENIERVILNLILNAIEAIENKGTINIKTYQVANDYAQISIGDTGCGMTREFIRDKLFQPFQTTKAKGLGVGLYQCKTIIDAMGGLIEVQSTPGVGSTFTVKIPLQVADSKLSI